ncbi:MAG: TetR/AcrR family transcriptional regulator [Cellulomonadaceae bacterium]|jgi:AcrR family transcriptional regulator|nr:TetR/AcrR family transcriptional regulator [Cellulomonadaceae bacterium]
MANDDLARQAVVGGIRNADRTRRAVLDAAGRLLADKGVSISLKEVADAAGVSKSGLLYHFSSRDELLLAVVQDINEQFRNTALKRLDLSENYPGKMLRAYVRTLCDESGSELLRFFAPSLLWSGMLHIPGASAEMEADEKWWDDQFNIDGFDPEIAHIICRFAEGVAAASALNEDTPEQIERARTMLLAMTEDPKNFL